MHKYFDGISHIKLVTRLSYVFDDQQFNMKIFQLKIVIFPQYNY